jgi:patatin-like phospholipase/acyl hydrolase
MGRPSAKPQIQVRRHNQRFSRVFVTESQVELCLYPKKAIFGTNSKHCRPDPRGYKEKAMSFQILALSGGGYLGLYTAEVLARLERQAGRPIGQCFDLIAGTSIGGILALGVAMEKSAASMRDLFIMRGPEIFSERGRPRFWWGDAWRSFFRPKYDGIALRTTIEDALGSDTLLREARHRVIVPSVNMTKGSVQMFKTAHHPRLVTDYRRRAVDIAMATSAAPTYFPLAETDNAYFADGGLVANAPDMCALHEACVFLDTKSEDVSILSIGTTTTGFSLPRSLGRRLGMLKWTARGRLFSTIVSAQQQMVDFMLKHQLGDRYLRIDTRPGEEQQTDLALDVANADARGTLQGLAEGAYQQFATNAVLVSMLNHQPARPKFYHPQSA